MKFLVVLCAVAACAAAKPLAGFAYSALAPLAPVSHYFPYTSIPYGAPPAVAPYPYASLPAPIAGAPVGIKTQYFAQDYAGQVSFGYAEPNSAQSVIQDAAGNKVGSYSYINPEGKLVRTDYVADSAGYRVASNDLPQAPVDQPRPVQDTPEVAEAKAKFFQQFEEAKNRNKRAADDNVQTPASTKQLSESAQLSPIHAIAPFSVPAPVTHIAYTAAGPVPFTYPAAAPVAAPFAYPYTASPYSYSVPYGYPYIYPAAAAK